METTRHHLFQIHAAIVALPMRRALRQLLPFRFGHFSMPASSIQNSWDGPFFVSAVEGKDTFF
jgi:hypothetical protein